MAVYIDPLTALALARDSGADQHREMAERRRLVEATRVARESQTPGVATDRFPRAVVRRLQSALWRRHAPA